jgi:hypothetical protein
MSARYPLRALIAAGLTVDVDADGVLLVGPRDLLTDDHRALIRTRKADVIAALMDRRTQPAALTSPPASAELLGLLDEVATLYSCTADERAEMTAAADRDPEGATRSFRAMLRESCVIPDQPWTYRERA